MSPGLKEIAAVAGVDIGTVSHVLNFRPKAALLRPATRERIFHIASELGYCRNEIASSLAKGHGTVLAFITSEMGSADYTGRIQSGVFDEACAHGFSVSLYHLNGGNHDEIVQRVLGWQTAGVIFHIEALEMAAPIIDILKKKGIPYGTANLSNPEGIGVTTDDVQGAHDAVKYLVELGHKNILFCSVGEQQSDSLEFSRNRLHGYLSAMHKYLPDVQPEILATSNPELSSVEGIRNRLRSSRPSAIFCLGDPFALRVVQAAVQEGISIPEQLSVIGYGGLIISEFSVIPLTTVIQDFEQVGSLTARMVISSLEQKSNDTTRQNVLLPVKLLIRKSTGKKSNTHTPL